MFTGLYRTQSERFENVLINFSLTSVLLLTVMKLIGVGNLSWLIVASPVIAAVALVIGLFALAALLGAMAGLFELVSNQISRLLKQ